MAYRSLFAVFVSGLIAVRGVMPSEDASSSGTCDVPGGCVGAGASESLIQANLHGARDRFELVDEKPGAGGPPGVPPGLGGFNPDTFQYGTSVPEGNGSPATDTPVTGGSDDDLDHDDWGDDDASMAAADDYTDTETDLGDGPSSIPMCSSDIVRETCERLNGGVVGSVTVNLTTLAEILTTNASNGSCLQQLFSSTPTCVDLCNASVAWLQASAAVIMPNATDVACWTHEGVTNCDIDVSPHSVALLTNTTVSPDHGEVVPNGTGGHATTSHGRGRPLPARVVNLVQYQSANKHGELAGNDHKRGTLKRLSSLANGQVQLKSKFALLDGSVRYDTCDDVAIKIANLFRIHPSNGREVTISGGGHANITKGGSGQGALLQRNDIGPMIAQYQQIALAWATTVIRELMDNNAAEFRQEWFRGQGTFTAAQVKTRILRTFNFVERELQDGFHYVYPGDNAIGGSCGGTTLAYVTGWVNSASGFYETVGPTCDPSASDGDGIQKSCGIETGATGKYYMYLCNWINQFDKQTQISTFIHEAVHHSGPGDKSYDESTMKTMAQSLQLDNADSYAGFGRTVVESAWGCAQESTVSVSGYSCGANNAPCPCGTLSSLCGTNTEVRSKCRATCGLCAQPTGLPSVGGGVSPTPPPAPTPVPGPVRRTEKGCSCTKEWDFDGTQITNYCGTPDGDSREWCKVSNQACEGSWWNYCKPAPTVPTPAPTVPTVPTPAPTPPSPTPAPTVPLTAASGPARYTVAGCLCQKVWTYAGQTIEDYCGNPDADPEGDWCWTNRNAGCSASWGSCRPAS